MTVKELIDELSIYDPNATVVVDNDESCCCDPITFSEKLPIKIERGWVNNRDAYVECAKGEQPDMIAVHLSTDKKPESSGARGSHAK